MRVVAVQYRPFDSELVSVEWLTFLVEARRDGVPFRVNEGHRTWARQEYFYNGWKRRIPGFNLAAKPSHNAPHIRTGRIDHALDIENSTGGAERLIAYGARNGVTITRPVRGESWHGEASADDLTRFHERHSDPLTSRERRLVNELWKIRDAHGKVWNKAELARAEEIKMWIRRQRGRINDEAGKSGWDKAKRRERYHALIDAYNARR